MSRLVGSWIDNASEDVAPFCLSAAAISSCSFLCLQCHAMPALSVRENAFSPVRSLASATKRVFSFATLPHPPSSTPVAYRRCEPFALALIGSFRSFRSFPLCLQGTRFPLILLCSLLVAIREFWIACTQTSSLLGISLPLPHASTAKLSC